MRVTATEVGVRYGARDVFQGVTAEFPENRLSALVGPSGSGKSSLLGVIAGYIKPASGIARYHSSAGDEKPNPARIGWVSQGANALGRRSALDNVAIGALSGGAPLDRAHEDATRELIRVGLGDYAEVMASDLSGGELQRVGFARALASRRPIILADEPSASLDEANTLNLAALLRDLRSTATIIVATHDPLLIDAAEHVVSLRGGMSAQ